MCGFVFYNIMDEKVTSKETTITQRKKQKSRNKVNQKKTFGNTVVNRMQKKQLLSGLEFLCFIPL